jgi:hypothetical protein
VTRLFAVASAGRALSPRALVVGLVAGVVASAALTAALLWPRPGPMARLPGQERMMLDEPAGAAHSP